MKAFDELLEVADKLHGEGGCLWDRSQTFFSLQPYILEEAHEVVEAVDGQNDNEIVEELGDLIYTVIFYGKIGEKEGRFSLSDILRSIKEKLVRRHPHVFEGLEVKNTEEIVTNWNRIKQTEEGKDKRTSVLDGIPEALPVLTKAQKMLKAIEKTSFFPGEPLPRKGETEIGEELLRLVRSARSSGVDAEGAFRRALSSLKKEFIDWERSSNTSEGVR